MHNKQTLKFASICIFAFLTSCTKEKETTACNTQNPTEELEWLKQEIAEAENDEYFYFEHATYKNKSVFISRTCNPSYNSTSMVKNCEGEIIGDRNDLENELTNITILWKHANSNCNI